MNELFNPEDVKKRFNSAAQTYDSVAVMQRESADRLFERLEIIKIAPTEVLDLGAGTGYCTNKLSQLYPAAKIFAVDPAEKMLSKINAADNVKTLCASAEKLPLEDNSVDLVFSNMMIHWSTDVAQVFKEIQRVLRPGGVLLFTTLGPDTLRELRSSWAAVDDYNHVHHFYDLHDIGDELLRQKFVDPVMDMNELTLCYKALSKLFEDMKLLGARNVAEPRKRGLTTNVQLKKMMQAYENCKVDNLYPTTYEILFGHAWGANTENEFCISIDSISKPSDK